MAVHPTVSDVKVSPRQYTRIKNLKPTDKIKYTSQSVKLDELVKRVNNDNDTLIAKVKSLVIKLQNDDFYNQRLNSSLLRQTIKNIVRELLSNKKTTSKNNVEDIKTKIINQIYSSVYLTKAKKQYIVQIIEHEVETLENELQYQINERNDEIKDKIYNSLKNVQLEEKTSLKIFENILKDNRIVDRVTNVLSNAILTKYLVNDKKELSIKISKFKHYNKKLFATNKITKANNTSFFDMVAKGENTNLFFIKYNHMVYRRFMSQIVNVKDITSMDKLRQKLIPRQVMEDLKKDLKKWWNTKTKFTKMFTKKFWTDLWNKKVVHKWDLLKRFLKNENIGTIAWTSLSLASSGVLKIGKMLYSLGKFSFNALIKSYNIITSVAGNVVNGVWNVVKLSFNVVKAFAITGYEFLKHIKIFLFSPIGAYTVGFIVGYFKEIIMEKYRKVTEWIEKTYEEIKEWVKEKFGVSDEKTQQSAIQIYFKNQKERLQKFLKKLKEYITIFDSKEGDTRTNEDKMIEFRKKLNEDTGGGYNNVILELEKSIGIAPKTIENYIQTIQNCIKEFGISDLVNDIKETIELAGTGVNSRKAAKGTIGKVIGGGIKMAGAAIGLVFGGPIGAILGGAAGGVISSLFEQGLNFGFSHMKYSKQEKFQQQKLLFEIEDEVQDRVNGGTTKHRFEQAQERHRQIDKELTKLEKNGKKQGDKEYDDLKIEQEKLNEEMEMLKDTFMEKGNSEKRLNGLGWREFLPALDLNKFADKNNENADILYRMLTETNREQQNLLRAKLKEGRFNKSNDIKQKDIIEAQEKISDKIQQILKRYALQYDNGIISKEQLKVKVQELSNFMNNGFIQDLMYNPHKLTEVDQDGKIKLTKEAYEAFYGTQINTTYGAIGNQRGYSVVDRMLGSLDEKNDTNYLNDKFEKVFEKYRSESGKMFEPSLIDQNKSALRNIYVKYAGKIKFEDLLKRWNNYLTYEADRKKQKTIIEFHKDNFKNYYDQYLESLKKVFGKANELLLNPEESQDAQRMFELMQDKRMKEDEELVKTTAKFDEKAEERREKKKKLEVVKDDEKKIQEIVVGARHWKNVRENWPSLAAKPKEESKAFDTQETSQMTNPTPFSKNISYPNISY